ncbi:MAG TPA: hypothetical protein VFG10_05690 [Saprospiraceae bacterium]|nr:hypothetical protein [Saprospiraceae bacterium]
MKKIILTIVLMLAAFIVGLKFKDDKSDKSGLRIVIDRYTTEVGLTEIIEQAKSEDMNITIDEAGYDARGTLKNIKGTVDFGDKGSGTFNSDRVGKIIIQRDLNSVDAGFSIVVKKRWI